MPYTFEGLATIGVLALYRGHPPNKLTSLELNVRVLELASKRFRLEFDHYLKGPKEANALQVILPDGRLLQGVIVEGSNEPAGGWLLIEIEQYELPLEPPASINGWRWE